MCPRLAGPHLPFAQGKEAKVKEGMKKVQIRCGWWEDGETSASAEVRGADSQ